MSINRQNLSVIIVSFKSEHIIDRCISSIDREIEIVVVDNSNNEEFKNTIEKKYKNVKCILSPQNIGMGAGNNLGIKNVKNDYALILNPDVCLEEFTLNELINGSKEIDNFGIIAPLSNKHEYPNYILDKFDMPHESKPFKVKSVDGFAILLNLKRLKQLHKFNFFDENFFLYLENDDLCKELKKRNENIYIVPRSKVNHSGAAAVNPKFKSEIELSRNWHWMWSKFYFNKKHYGYSKAILKVSNNLISAVIKFFYYLIIFNSSKRKIYKMRLLGLVVSMIGHKSYYRPKLDD